MDEAQLHAAIARLERINQELERRCASLFSELHQATQLIIELNAQLAVTTPVPAAG